MKSIIKKLSILLFSLFFITSCTVKGFNSVIGNKKVVTHERKANDTFDKIHVSQGINLFIRLSNENTIVVEADENLQNIIKTEIKDGVLKIYTKETIFKASAKNVYVSLKEIKEIKASSGSFVRSENTLISEYLSLKSSSGSEINISTNAEEITSSSSSGSEIKLEGKTQIHNAIASSGSEINALQLKSNEASAKVSSGASIEIHSSGLLNARASSGGSIEFVGNPKKIEKITSSGGDISKK